MEPQPIEAFQALTSETVLGAWLSPEFFVVAYREEGAMRLAVNRTTLCDGRFIDGITWDELMQVKRECGFGQKDAVEFYPADDAIVNTQNIRHLYIFEEKLPLVRRG